MIVQITKSRFSRDRVLDWDSEGLNQVSYKYIRVRYDFVTKKGYTGYIESPRCWINFFRVENIVHEYLDESDSKLWFDQIDPKPYLGWIEDEDGYRNYVNRFKGKYFYKIRFKNNTWVDVKFNDIVIKQLAPSQDTDPFNVNSFLICPWGIVDITPVEIEHPTKTTDYMDDLPF